MTTISVPGKITAIEVDEGGEFTVTSLAGGSVTSPTTISPGGQRHTIVMASSTAPPGRFKLDVSFSVGDVVEVYSADGNGFFVVDENGVAVATGGSFSGQGVILRKIATGSGAPLWGSA